jgi:hypothetical protein
MRVPALLAHGVLSDAQFGSVKKFNSRGSHNRGKAPRELTGARLCRGRFGDWRSGVSSPKSRERNACSGRRVPLGHRKGESPGGEAPGLLVGTVRWLSTADHLAIRRLLITQPRSLECRIWATPWEKSKGRLPKRAGVCKVG